MASIERRVLTKVTQVDGSIRERSTAKTWSSLTEVYERQLAIAASATVVVWDPTNDAGVPASFDVLQLTATVDLELELTCNEGDADEELSHLPLEAGVEFCLGADDARYTYTTDSYAGTLDVIDKIRVKEVNAVAGNLYVLIGKV